MEFLNHLKVGIAITLTSILSLFSSGTPNNSVPVNQNLGGVATTSGIPAISANYDDSLASNINQGATSMTLVRGTDRDGNNLSGRYCFTLDEGSPQLEYVCGTASSTSVTALERGLSFSNPNTTSTARAFPHRRGSNVKITDYPWSGFANRLLNGQDGFDSLLKYATTIGTSSFTNAQHLVSKGYVDATAFAGAPAGSETVAGIGIFSTRAQLSAGTATSSYSGLDYLLIPKNQYFNATSSATTTVPVTKTNGKLSQGFLDLTEGITFSGGVTSTGATSLATTTINNTLNVTGTSTLAGVSATNLSVSGAITGSVTSPSYIGQAGFNSSNASSSRVISGLSFTPQRVTVFGGQSGGYTTGFGFSGGYGTATSSQKSSFLNNGCGAGSSSNTVFYTANIRNFSGSPCDATLSVAIGAMGTSSVTLVESVSGGADAGSSAYTYIIE
jgi:hypothetical protein